MSNTSSRNASNAVDPSTLETIAYNALTTAQPRSTVIPTESSRDDGVPRNPAPMRIRRPPSASILGASGSRTQRPELRPARSATLLTASNASSSRDAARTRTEEAAPDGEQGRRRSFSDPQRPMQRPPVRADLPAGQTAQNTLPTVIEEKSTGAPTPRPSDPSQTAVESNTDAKGRVRAASKAGKHAIERSKAGSNVGGASPQNTAWDRGERTEEYETEVTDFLDVIDPEVSTLTTLNNVQNSLFIPYLGRLYSRQPTYDLTRSPTVSSSADQRATRQKTKLEEHAADDHLTEKEEEGMEQQTREGLYRLHTIKSTLSGMSVGHNYAVLPHGVRLEGWTEEEKEDLNDHVRHLLHSRRESFKRSMRAFGKYVRKPVGFFVTLYAFIITFWGAAWVLFLIGWLHAGNRQAYFVEICDQILTAMLVVFGIGLFPWRVVDTYHMIYIAHYHYKIWSIRRRRGMPDLQDPNDLPDTDPRVSTILDAEAAAEMRGELTPKMSEENAVLTLEQQRKLKHHQDKFAKSHTFFKPHETPTHHAFSIKLLITVVVLLDFHSFFQMALGGTTWGIYYRERPRALTAVILAFSICCNISGGIVISVGDHRSRKKEVFEQILRQKRTDEAMKRIERKKGKTRLKISESVEDLEQRLKAEEDVNKTLASKEAIERGLGR